ncbi:MAG TPA: hypothetical protein VJL80_09960 [Aeromicrobium sp.]|nr:hypothetical protein [Aeromicrobium sp.]HKY58351.1 hypothetical protein [Aeromicrobium sp.]
MSGLRIGVDVDDVLFPWFEKAHAACERAGITNGITPATWECWKDYGCTLDDWLAVMEKVTLDGSLYAGDPYPGVRDALAQLVDAGHTVHFVTARGFFKHGDLIKRMTVEWINDYDLPHHSLTFTKDKTVMRLDVAVDDSVKNVTDLTAAQVRVCMVDAPHNTGHQHTWREPTFVDFVRTVLA